ncbi:MAG: hypothetical protein NT159_03380 [Proteobacteria bacterium]|nr:hypothetical protein [Pseudomonadota bacterium]
MKTTSFRISSLPTPAELLSLLKHDEAVELDGNTLIRDDDGVWLTNAYGVDAALWQSFGEAEAARLLDRVAAGIEYGLVPV